MNKTMRTVVCYKLNNPIVYNKGTKYESSCDTFLAYYTFKSKEEAQKEVDEINNGTIKTLFNGEATNIHDRVYFVSEQEEMY